MLRPLVLLSNDDGYRASGIAKLREALVERFDVVICAPDAEQSASSHSLSLHRPLRVEKHDEGCFSVDGTPADSIYVALHEPSLLPRRPDVIVSGMNHGLNLGQDVFYSGTVAAAREGALHGFPSVAFSADRGTDLSAASRDASELVHRLILAKSGRCLLNVNYPASGDWRKVATVSGRRVYSGGLDARTDPRGRHYYWIGGDSVKHESEPGTDTEAFDAGQIGVTQLVLSLSIEDGAAAVAVCTVSSLTD